MREGSALFSAFALAVFLTAGGGEAVAATERENALDEGAKELSPDEIAETMVGKTGTWASPSGDMKIEIYYGEENDLHGDMIDGDWSATGLYGVTTDGHVCVSWHGRDEGRFRCLDVLMVDGTVTKFNPDGSVNGIYEGFEDGKAF